MKKKLLCLFILLFAAWQGVGFTINGELTVYSGLFFDGDYARNSANALFKIDQRVGRGEVKAELDFFYSTIDSARYADDNYKPDFLMRQLYYRIGFEFEEKAISEVELKVGFVKFTWGKSDELRVLDILNPQYLNYSLLDKIEKRKIGRFAFSLGVAGGEGTRLEAIFMPLLQKSIFRNQVLMPKKMQEIYQYHSAKTNGQGLAYSDPDALTIKDASFGARFRDTKFGIDYDIYFYHGYFNQPVYYWAPESAPSLYATESYSKINMLGFDFEKNIGGFVFRGEAAWFFNRVIPVADVASDVAGGGNGSLRKNYLQFVVGFDHRNFLAENLYFNLQYALNKIVDYEDSLLPEENEHTLTAKIELNHKDKLKLAINYSRFIDRGQQINPELYIKLDQGVDLYFGVYIFIMDEDDYFFGSYDDLDLGYVKFAIKF